MKLMKNIARSEKTQSPKKRGVIANPSSFFVYQKTRSPFFKTGAFNASPTI
jgi:hypothetical protein